jgi:hypothetical protein
MERMRLQCHQLLNELTPGRQVSRTSTPNGRMSDVRRPPLSIWPAKTTTPIPSCRPSAHARRRIYLLYPSASSPLAKNHTLSRARPSTFVSAPRSMSKAPGDTRILTHVPRTLHGGGVHQPHVRLSRSLFGVSCARRD